MANSCVRRCIRAVNPPQAAKNAFTRRAKHRYWELCTLHNSTALTRSTQQVHFIVEGKSSQCTKIPSENGQGLGRQKLQSWERGFQAGARISSWNRVFRPSYDTITWPKLEVVADQLECSLNKTELVTGQVRSRSRQNRHSADQLTQPGRGARLGDQGVSERTVLV